MALFMLTILSTLLFFSFFVSSTLATPANVTIDDADGDSANPTGIRSARLTFIPSRNGYWADQNGGRAFFALLPDPSKAFRNTYTATTNFSTSTKRAISLEFTGTGVYVYFTLPPSTFPATECTFQLDDGPPLPLKYTAGADADFTYQFLAFSRSGMKHSRHRLVIEVEAVANKANYLNFDYAQYTFDDAIPEESNALLAPSPTPTSSEPVVTPVVHSQTSAPNSPSQESAESERKSSSNKGPIIAGIISATIGGSILVGAAFMTFFLRRRWQKRGLFNPLNRGGAGGLPDMHSIPPDTPEFEGWKKKFRAFGAVDDADEKYYRYSVYGTGVHPQPQSPPQPHSQPQPPSRYTMSSISSFKAAALPSFRDRKPSAEDRSPAYGAHAPMSRSSSFRNEPYLPARAQTQSQESGVVIQSQGGGTGALRLTNVRDPNDEWQESARRF